MDIDPAEDNPYAPFASEVDWRVAQWAVKETVGQSAFDRFLEIPGVSHLQIHSIIHLILFQVVEKLGLSFNNVRGLHKIVDAQPEKAGEWTTSHLSFHDDPSTTFTVRHRPVLETIQAIFNNPQLAFYLVLSSSPTYLWTR